MTEPQIWSDAKLAKLIEDECNTGDPNADHRRADEILCQILASHDLHKTVEAFKAVEKWYE